MNIRLLVKEPRHGLEVWLASGAEADRDALARSRIAARLGCRPQDVAIGRAPQGAPILLAPSSPLRLSLSGRGGVVLVGLAPCALGVDAEPVGAPFEPSMDVPWNVLHPGEQAFLRALGDSTARHLAFLRIWTAKEAVLKAWGVGLRREPASFEIVLNARGLGWTRSQPGEPTTGSAFPIAPHASGDVELAGSACGFTTPDAALRLGQTGIVEAGGRDYVWACAVA